MWRNWKFWAVVVVVIVVGLLIGRKVWAEREADRLLSNDSAVQTTALDKWDGVNRPNERALSASPSVMRAIDRRLKDASDAVLLNFFITFRSPDYWDSPHMPAMRGVIEAYLERATTGPLEYRASLPYAAVVFGFVVNGLEKEMMPHIERMFDGGDEKFREAVLFRAIDFLSGDRRETIVALALDDPSNEVARLAWLSVGTLDPLGGFSGNWHEAPDEVAAAIVYAAVATSDRPEEILGELEAAHAHRLGWVRPFLDRAIEVREGVAGFQPTLNAAQEQWIDENLLFEGHRALAEAARPSRRMSSVHLLTRGVDLRNGDMAALIRWLFRDHPLPTLELEQMTERQQNFASELVSVWWAVHNDDYEFDESAKVFRRKTNKAPE